MRFGVIGIVVAQTLQAQVPADSATRLEPVVVTATRLLTPRASVAATVTVLEGDALRALGYRHVLDALRSVPGLNVVQTGSFGGNTSVFLRGGESDYVKVLLDGVPLNDPGGTFDFANLTLDNVERIELVRGPTSVLYGSDAVAGVVQILTRRGEGPPRAEIAIRGGTYASVVVDGNFAGGSESMSYAFSFSRSTSDGSYAFNNDYDNMVLSGSVRATPDTHTEANFTVRYTDSEFHFPTDGIGRVVDRNSFRLQDRVTGALEVSRFFTDHVEGRVLFALNETDGGIDDESDGPADTLGFFSFKSLDAVVRRSADVRANIYLSSRTVITAGAQLENEKQRSFSESHSEFGSSNSSREAERLNRGYYAQLQAGLASGIAFNAGVRVDDNEAFGTFFTYRGGATYLFGSGTRVRASVGKAFKEPTFFENFSQDPFAMGNPDLAPERSVSWEVAAEQSFLGGRIVAAATHFYQRFRDLVQFTSSPPGQGDPNFYNVAAADASGLELEINAHLGRLTLGGNYTYLDTRVTDAGFDTGAGAGFVVGERLLRRPTRTLSGSARYRILDRASLGLSLHHVGDRDDRDFSTFPATPVVLPSYTTVNAAASYTIVPRGGSVPAVTLSLRVENLFDRKYGEVFGFPARGRTVVLGGKLGF